MRVVVELDDNACLRQATAVAAGRTQVETERSMVIVAPNQVFLPSCWLDSKPWRPSVADALQAQAARCFEMWRWSDTFEQLIDQVGGVRTALLVQGQRNTCGDEPEPELEPQPKIEPEEGLHLDLAAAAASGVELLPELSDDWIAAFRS